MMEHTKATELVTAERIRQIEVKGYTPEHDTKNHSSALAWAGIAYTMDAVGVGTACDYWPWSDDTWKPADRVRTLVKAAALICAEIDRRLAEGD